MQLICKTAPRAGDRLALSPAGKANPKAGISFDLAVGGSPGANTCKAKCEQCFLRIGPGPTHSAWGAKKSIDEKIAAEKVLINDLSAQGYSICPVIPDTFSWNGKYLESGMLYQNALYGADELATTGVAWTSGLTLLNSDRDRLLGLAYDNNLRLIGISSHGAEDGETPLKGVVKPSIVRRVLKNIREYNRAHPDKKFEISLGFTIGAHNVARVRDYVAYAAMLGADYVRLNRLLDVSGASGLTHLVLSKEQSRAFFMQMHEIEQNNFDWLAKSATALRAYQDQAQFPNPDIKVVISTDFGFDGEEALEKPEPINRCSGGASHFGIFSNSIYACLELIATGFRIGALVLEDRAKVEREIGASIASGRPRIHTPVFDVEMVRQMQKIMDAGDYNGCLAHSQVRHNRAAQ